MTLTIYKIFSLLSIIIIINYMEPKKQTFLFLYIYICHLSEIFEENIIIAIKLYIQVSSFDILNFFTYAIGFFNYNNLRL